MKMKCLNRYKLVLFPFEFMSCKLFIDVKKCGDCYSYSQLLIEHEH